MEYFLIMLGSFIFVIGLIALLIGFIMAFYEDKRKLALQIILYSIIALVIGFGTCLANFQL